SPPAAPAPPAQPAIARPMTAAALPQTLIGAVTGTVAWLPPPTLCRPLVRPPAPEPPRTGGMTPSQPATASPRTAAALPQTLIGAVTGTFTWLPPPTLCRPEVDPPVPLP